MQLVLPKRDDLRIRGQEDAAPTEAMSPLPRSAATSVRAERRP
jgi:hypothetical protein